MDDSELKLKTFETILYQAYCVVKNETKTLYVSLHTVMQKVGLPIYLFNVRLDELWRRQFKEETEYVISLAHDATPTEFYRLRGKPIVIDGCKMFLIQMTKKDKVSKNEK